MVHKNITDALHYRQRYLTQIRTSWTPNNISIAIDSAVRINDNAVIVDLFSVLIQNNHLFTLDTTLLLLPQLYQLSNSKCDSCVNSACRMLKIVLESFSSLIERNLSFPPAYVYISREERHTNSSTSQHHRGDFTSINLEYVCVCMLKFIIRITIIEKIVDDY